MCKGRNALSKAVLMVKTSSCRPGPEWRARQPPFLHPGGPVDDTSMTLARVCTSTVTPPIRIRIEIVKSIPCRGGEQPPDTIVGDHRSMETPVPIPNTEVKHGPPMILLSGKVGHCRLGCPPSATPGARRALSLIPRHPSDDHPPWITIKPTASLRADGCPIIEVALRPCPHLMPAPGPTPEPRIRPRIAPDPHRNGRHDPVPRLY